MPTSTNTTESFRRTLYLEQKGYVFLTSISGCPLTLPSHFKEPFEPDTEICFGDRQQSLPIHRVFWMKSSDISDALKKDKTSTQTDGRVPRVRLPNLKKDETEAVALYLYSNGKHSTF